MEMEENLLGFFLPNVFSSAVIAPPLYVILVSSLSDQADREAVILDQSLPGPPRSRTALGRLPPPRERQIAPIRLQDHFSSPRPLCLASGLGAGVSKAVIVLIGPMPRYIMGPCLDHVDNFGKDDFEEVILDAQEMHRKVLAGVGSDKRNATLIPMDTPQGTV